MSANEPDVADDEYGEYAVDVTASPMRVWQYREGIVTNDKSWQNVDSVPESDGLQLELESATLRPSGWVYTERLEVTESAGGPTENEDTGETADHDYYVKFDDSDRIGGKNQAEAYAAAVRWLMENDALEEHISIPYGLGNKNYVLNNKPKHSQGGDMHRPQDVGDGLHLETSVPKEQKKKHIKNLADECEQSTMFGGEWS
jgi:hypothetical protein